MSDQFSFDYPDWFNEEWKVENDSIIEQEKTKNEIFKDILYVRTEFSFSKMDRIRILFTGKMVTRTEVDTEHEIGNTRTHVSVKVPRIFSRVRKIRRDQEENSTDTETCNLH